MISLGSRVLSSVVTGILLTLGCAAILVNAEAATTTATRTYSCHNVTTEILVNETVSEWCAGIDVTCAFGFFSDSCYCDTIKEVKKTHTTTVCEDLTLVDDAKPGDTGTSSGKRKLTDPEVAAIAVICSLVFSILISLSVFLIQRRNRLCLSCKPRPHPDVVEVAAAGGDTEMAETDKFLPQSGGSSRYVHVEPANVECDVYEEIGKPRINTDPPPDKGVSSLGAHPDPPSYSRLSSEVRYAASPPVKSTNKRDSTESCTQTSPLVEVKPLSSPRHTGEHNSNGSDRSDSDSEQYTTPSSNIHAPGAPTSTSQADTSTSQTSLHSPTEQLYENVPTSTL